MTTVPTHTAKFAQTPDLISRLRVRMIKKTAFDFTEKSYDCYQLSHNLWLLYDSHGNLFPIRAIKLSSIKLKRTFTPLELPTKPRIKIRGVVRNLEPVHAVQIAV